MGVPKMDGSIWFIVEHPMKKWMIWGYPISENPNMVMSQHLLIVYCWIQGDEHPFSNYFTLHHIDTGVLTHSHIIFTEFEHLKRILVKVWATMDSSLNKLNSLFCSSSMAQQ